MSEEGQKQPSEYLVINDEPLVNQLSASNDNINRSISKSHLLDLDPQILTFVQWLLADAGIRKASVDSVELIARLIREVGFDLLNESLKLSQYASKPLIDDKDIKFAFNLRYRRSLNKNPDINLAKELSIRKNCLPMQNIKSSNKLNLPSERNVLLSRNFTVANESQTSGKSLKLDIQDVEKMIVDDHDDDASQNFKQPINDHDSEINQNLYEKSSLFTGLKENKTDSTALNDVFIEEKNNLNQDVDDLAQEIEIAHNRELYSGPNDNFTDLLQVATNNKHNLNMPLHHKEGDDEKK